MSWNQISQQIMHSHADFPTNLIQENELLFLRFNVALRIYVALSVSINFY